MPRSIIVRGSEHKTKYTYDASVDPQTVLKC